MVTDNLVAILDSTYLADVEANRSVELQRVTTRGGLWVAEHHADLLAKLVDEDTGGVGLVDSSGEFAESLRHESCLQTYFVVTHISFNLSFWGEGRYRVDDNQIHCSTADKFVRNIKCLFATVWLRDEQVIGVDTQFLSIETVECVFGIDDSRDTALLLYLCHSMDGESGFTRRLWTINLYDTSARVTAYAKCDVESY